MTKREYEEYIETTYKNALKLYADYANAKYFNDTSLKVSTKDMNSVFTEMAKMASNINRICRPINQGYYACRSVYAVHTRRLACERF